MSEAAALTAPHNDEAEQALLGALLLDNGAWERTADLVSADDFYHPDHRGLWDTISRLINANKVADVITVHETGGHDLVYANDLVASVVSSAHARAYAEIVSGLARLRTVMGIGAALAEDARRAKAGDVTALVDNAVTRLLALAQSDARTEPVPISDLLVQFVDKLNDRYEGRHPGIGTKLSALDRLTSGGGRKGRLWVIGARPSHGKTALVLHLSRAVGEEAGVLMLTLEDSNDSVVDRHVASAGRVNLSQVLDPRNAPETLWQAVTVAVDELQKLRIQLDDEAGITLADVRRKVQQAKRRDPSLSLVIVDYLGLMDGEGDNRNQQLGAIANGMKRAAKDLGVWIVLLSQLSREADKRSGVPQLSDLRDSGDIEGAADLVGLLHREFRRKPRDEYRHWAQMHVAKNKFGPTDTINLWFDGETQRFGNWEGPAPSRGLEGA